jgi:hypothetical protein
MTRRFSERLLSLFAAAPVLRIRAGADHRFLGIWVVVARGRVFVRPWNDKPAGWRQTFLENPNGAVLIRDVKREIRVRARPASGERLCDAIDDAYAAKYSRPANRKWVRGLQAARRRKTTMELLPRSARVG